MNVKNEILEIMRQNARITEETLATMLGISKEEVSQALKELEEKQIILGYQAVLNTELLEDAPAEALIQLKVCPQRDFGYDDIARRVYKFPEVKALYLMSGGCDLAVRVEAQTMKDISQFVWEKLSVLEGISSTETLFIMRKYKEHGEILVQDEKEERLVISP